LPEAVVLEAMAKAPLCVEPGSSLSLSLRLADPPGKPGLVEQVRRQVTEQLQRAGIRVANQAPVVLEMTMTHSSTGEMHEYEVSSFGRGRSGTLKVPGQKVDCRAAVICNGKRVWEVGASPTNTIISAHLEEGETAEAHLAKVMWEGAASFFLNFVPPSRVFAEGSAEGLGNTDLTSVE
jgi:hypothetical protein